MHRVGAVCLPVDPSVAAGRLQDIVSRTRPVAIIADRPLSGAGDVPGLAMANLGEADGHSDRNAAAMAIEPGAPADIIFTSGTTGRPKGVILSHTAIATAAAQINAVIGNGGADTEVLPLPLSHSFGLGRLRCNLAAGGTLVLVGGFSSPGTVIEAIAEHGATGLASVPTGLSILLNAQTDALKRFADRLRYIEIGSAPMSEAMKRHLMEQLPHTRLLMHYGLTEASRSAFISFHDDVDRLDSVGRPTPGVSIRIVDEQGGVCPPGRQGSIEISGGHLMSGYWEDDALSSTALHDGWLKSGDIGTLDESGSLHLLARDDDMINVGGKKVPPEEVEAMLEEHPAVAQCACVGFPDPQGISGQIIKAFLVAAEGATPPKKTELATLIRSRLELYKLPRDFIWIASIPATAAGKLQRRRLRDRYENDGAGI